MPDYPQNIHEVNLDAVAFSPEMTAAIKAFAQSRPWRGTIDERKGKIEAAILNICAAAGVQPPQIVFEIDESQHSGSSCYIPSTRTIMLRGKLSVISMLHEVSHHLSGASEYTAVAWSVAAFRLGFPRSFSRLTFRGHVAVARRRRDRENP